MCEAYGQCCIKFNCHVAAIFLDIEKAPNITWLAVCIKNVKKSKQAY
jgi:hypothetical protein